MLHSVVEYLIGWLESFSYLGIFVLLMLCGLGLPLPEEPVLIAGGYVAYKGYTQLLPTIVVSMAAILLGDLAAFYLGRRYGQERAITGFFKRHISLRTLVRARRFMRDHGNKTIFLVRFMPGLRMPTYFMAGSLGMRVSVFLTYDFLAALISAPVSIVLAWYFGEHIDAALKASGRFHRYLLAAVVLAALVWLWYFFKRRREARAAAKLASQAVKASK
jgi:membrane protein DedA with SNARE-associated domain